MGVVSADTIRLERLLAVSVGMAMLVMVSVIDISDALACSQPASMMDGGFTRCVRL